jgi:precorrin-2/cobalt-factor-2 C20-methyltransferase
MYLFGRVAERYPVEVVPGVSSLTACAAVLGAPLAARNDVLTVVPAPLDEAVLSARLRDVEAAAVIKVGRHLQKVRRVLKDLNLLDRARYVERATLGEQRILPLETLEEATAPYFSMILIHRRGEAWT